MLCWDPATPKEIRLMGKEAKGSHLPKPVPCFFWVASTWFFSGVEIQKYHVGLNSWIFSFAVRNSTCAYRAGPGKSLNSVLFDAWCQCQEGDWDRSSFLLTIRARRTSKKRGIRKWLLPHEMNLQFTEPIAEAMRLRKQTDDELWASETRFHPELPQTEDCPVQIFSN